MQKIRNRQDVLSWRAANLQLQLDEIVDSILKGGWGKIPDSIISKTKAPVLKDSLRRINKEYDSLNFELRRLEHLQ